MLSLLLRGLFSRLLTSYISFIYFYISRKFISTWRDHGTPEFVKPSPCSFITAQSQNPHKPQGTGPILLTSQPPYNSEPKNQWLMSTMKNSTGNYRYFMVAISTLIKSTINWSSFFTSTTWTLKSIWPTQLIKVITAGLFRIKSCLEFHNSLGVIFHYPLIYI